MRLDWPAPFVICFVWRPAVPLNIVPFGHKICAQIANFKSIGLLFSANPVKTEIKGKFSPARPRNRRHANAKPAEQKNFTKGENAHARSDVTCFNRPAQLPEAAASVLMPTEWSKQKHHALTQPQFDKLWEKTIPFLPVATKKGFRKSKPADLSMGYARKILRNELEAKKAAASSGKKPRAKKKRAQKKRENTQAGVSNAALRKKRIRVSNAV